MSLAASGLAVIAALLTLSTVSRRPPPVSTDAAAPPRSIAEIAVPADAPSRPPREVTNQPTVGSGALRPRRVATQPAVTDTTSTARLATRDDRGAAPRQDSLGAADIARIAAFGARARAVEAGATAADLARGDADQDTAEALARGDRVTDAIRRLTSATTAWTEVERSLRNRQAVVEPVRRDYATATSRQPDFGCEALAQLRSGFSSTPTTIEFVNRRTSSVRIHWVDHAGQLKLFNELGPAGRHTQATYVSHPWQVEGGGTCLGVWLPTPQPRVVDIW